MRVRTPPAALEANREGSSVVERLVANEKAAGSSPVPRSMYYVYIIRSLKNNRYYTGSTNNLKRRIKEHNSNKTKSLKNKGPFTLIYQEAYKTLKKARARETEIKSYKSGNAFKKLIKER